MMKKSLRELTSGLLVTTLLLAVSGCGFPRGGEETASPVTSDKTQDLDKDATTNPEDPRDNADAFNDANNPGGVSGTDNPDGVTLEPSSDATFKENPAVKLPSKVAASIPNDAHFVGPKYVQQTDGTLLDAATGEKVTDPDIVGSPDLPPDPLAKSGGQSFIPVEVGTVREEVKATNSSASGSVNNSASDTDGSVSSAAFVIKDDGELQPSVTNVALQNNNYGAYWGSYNSTQAFFEQDGDLFAQQAKGVIDVSEWQKIIDWNKVKESSVEGAIIRIGYGNDSLDPYAMRNISECRRLRIPFGIYFFSYAGSATSAKKEASAIISMLQSAGVTPNALKYPVYYDLENWAWNEGTQIHIAPTNPNTNEGIVNAWYEQMKAGGYQDLGVYSYTSLLNSTLNTGSIHAKTRWVAQYGSSMQFKNFGTNDRAWQYWSSGSVNGILGNVDLNAFGNKTFQPTVQMTWYSREEDIAVGASVLAPTDTRLEYKWQAYDLAMKQWFTIANWTGANWAGWKDEVGDKWLHLEVRNGETGAEIGRSTIAFRYSAGATKITGTYAGWDADKVLLGISGNGRNCIPVIKIYDYSQQKWITQFRGTWAHWSPAEGTYWTHFELYTSDGRLADVRTYSFEV